MRSTENQMETTRDWIAPANPITSRSIAVWFSCGAASAVAAKRTVELYGGVTK